MMMLMTLMRWPSCHSFSRPSKTLRNLLVRQQRGDGVVYTTQLRVHLQHYVLKKSSGLPLTYRIVLILSAELPAAQRISSERHAED